MLTNTSGIAHNLGRNDLIPLTQQPTLSKSFLLQAVIPRKLHLFLLFWQEEEKEITGTKELTFFLKKSLFYRDSFLLCCLATNEQKENLLEMFNTNEKIIDMKIKRQCVSHYVLAQTENLPWL